MLQNLEFGVFPEWLALPMDTPADELAASIVATFADDPKPADVKQSLAAGLATMRSQVAAASNDQLQVFTVWVLLPLGGTLLSPQAVAFGALVSAPGDTTPMDLVERILDGAELHQPVDLQELATPLGQAHVVRARTFATTDHGAVISETTSVLWILEDDDVAVVVTSLPVDDLVQASDVASAVIGLAETASGSTDSTDSTNR